MYSFKAYMDSDTIYGEVYYNGTKIGTQKYNSNFKYFKDNVSYSGTEAVLKSLEYESETFGFFFNGNLYQVSNYQMAGDEVSNEEEDINYEKEEVEIGYSDMKIKYNIAKPLDKTMAAVFGFDVISQADYDDYVKNIKPNTNVVNPEKPGLATLFKQAILTVGDMMGFLFKLIKDAIDQLIKSFIMPILTPAAPFTLPIIIKNIIDIIMKIIEMVKEALTLVTDTLNWLLEKVAGKIANVKIPIPEFKIPLFGLSLTIPAFDQLKLLKVEPFPGLPSIKIDNFNSQIADLEKARLNIPITDLKEKMSNLQKIKDIGSEIDKLKEIQDSDVKSLEKELSNVNDEINSIYDKNKKENKDFMDKSLNLMKTALDVLNSMLFMSTYDLSKTVIDMHNDVIIKKKELLDTYLKKLISSGKGTFIDFSNLEDFSNKLKEQNIILSNYNTGINVGVIKSNDITQINSNTNYIMNITKKGIETNAVYKTNYIKYNFTDRLEIFLREYNGLDNNKKVVKEYKSGSKKLYNYVYTGDKDYLRYVSGFLIDELEKEEFDLEEEINKYEIEKIPEYKEKIDTLNKLLNEPYTKILKKDEQYRTPKLSKAEKEGYIKLGKEIPKEDVLIKELVVDGYRKRIIDQKNNIENIIVEIRKLEETITSFEKVIKDSGVTGKSINPENLDDPNVKKLNELKDKRKELENELNEVSPESVRSSKIIQLLLAIISFPIQIIVMLLSDLFMGIIDFITSLPLLNFEKIIQFFSKLLNLPSKEGMSSLINTTIGKYTDIAEDAIKPITSAVDGASESISEIVKEYELNVSVPFEIPVSQEKIEMFDDSFYKRRSTDKEFFDELSSSFGNEVVGGNFTDSNGNVDWDAEMNTWDKISPSPDVKIINSNLLNDFHPQKRQKVFNDIEEMIRMLKTKYQTDVYIYITSVRRGAKKGSAHYYGLAFDNNIFVGTGKGKYVAINSFANAQSALTNPMMKDAVKFMSTRNWEWGGTYTGPGSYNNGKGGADPVHFELNPYDKYVKNWKDNINFTPLDNSGIYPNLDNLA